MPFGDEIGGFKYIRPQSTDDDQILDAQNNDQDASPSSIDSHFSRSITSVTRSVSQLVIVQISNLLDEVLNVQENKDDKVPPQWKQLRIALEKLFIENRDLGKSINRLLKDARSAQNIGSSFLRKVRSELFTPLKNYIGSDPTIPDESKQGFVDQLNMIDLNLSTSSLELLKKEALQKKGKDFLGR